MFYILIYLLITISAVIITLILLQPSKQQDALSLLFTDKNSILFKSQKFRSPAHYLQYITTFLAMIWLVLAIVLVSISNIS